MLPYYLAYGIQEYLKQRVCGLDRAIGCSLAPTIQCNLKCKHCYEVDNRNSGQEEMTLEEFDALAEGLVRQGMKHCTLTDGEPLISRESIAKCESAVRHFWMTYIVTNGTQEFIDLPVSYVMSLDGPQKVHDSIRGDGVFDMVKENLKSAPTDRIWGLCTLNSINHPHIQDTVETAKGLGLRGLMFNWHTPSRIDDPLWIDLEKRNKNIDQILDMKGKYPDQIYNEAHVLETMRTSDWTAICPARLVPSYDAYGNLKEPCIFGGAICERCGCHIYPALRTSIMEGKGTGQFRMVIDHVDRHWAGDENLFSNVYDKIYRHRC